MRGIEASRRGWVDGCYIVVHRIGLLDGRMDKIYCSSND